MKPRTHICLVIGMLVGLFSLAIEGPATAQRFPDPTPFAVPSLRRPAAGGLFYIQGGLRFRNVQTVRMNSLPHSPEHRKEGTPPFGPPVAGPFGAGTGVPPTYTTSYGRTIYQRMPDYNAAGGPYPETWNYDDNSLVTNEHVGFGDLGCDESGVPVVCLPSASRFRDWMDGTEPNLGRFVMGSNPTTYACCDSLFPTNVYIGHFVIGDTYKHPLDSEGRNTTERLAAGLSPLEINDTDAPFSNGTDFVRFQRLMDMTVDYQHSTEDGEYSLILRAQGQMFQNQEFMEKIWTPCFEIGYQYTDFFDLFYGFSFFDISPSLRRSYTIDGQVWRRAFVDTFPFYSDHPNDFVWGGGSFESTGVILGGEIRNYQIAPDSSMKGSYPTRSFTDVRDYNFIDPVTLGLPQLREDLSNRADIHTYENRLGFRSWFPLYGMGRVGFSVGAVLSFISYRLTGSRTVTSINDIMDHSDPASEPVGVVVISAGEVIQDEAHSFSDTWFNYGGFFGTDLEINYNGFLAKAALDWALCEEESAQLYSIKTEYNPGGFSMFLAGGVRF